MAALRAAGLDDVQVIVGGIVPPKDERMLMGAGVACVFHPGASLDAIADTVRALSTARRAQLEGSI